MPLVRKPTGAPGASEPASADVLSALASANPDERWAAARAAGDMAGAATALATAMRTEGDPRVREAIFTSLGRIGSAQSANELLGLLRSDDAELRTGALDALRLAVPRVGDLLPRLLQDSDPDVRLLSCELARSLPGDQATHLLCGLLAREQELNVCAAAVEVLAEVGTAEALRPLTECARRFSAAPFLGFAIKIAADRINSQSTASRE